MQSLPNSSLLCLKMYNLRFIFINGIVKYLKIFYDV